MISKQTLTALRHFFGTQFHQDYDLEADDPDTIVKLYMAESTSQELKDLGQGLLDYMQGMDDAELDERLFKELSCYYYPQGVGISAREWLSHVAKMFIENDRPS